MSSDIPSLYCARMTSEPAAEKAAPDPAAQPQTADNGLVDAQPRPRPTGEPAKVTAVRELIEQTLEKLGISYVVDDRSNYVVGVESARVFIVPTWMDDGPTVIRIFAITNLDVPVTADLTGHLLAKNLDFVLGAFALDKDKGAIWFNHNLLGEFAAPDELEAALAAVAHTADGLDDEIKGRFGGRLYTDAPDSAVPPPPTPGYL